MKKAIITLLFAAASIIVVDAQVMPVSEEILSSQNAPEEAGPKTKAGKWFKEALGHLTVGGYGEVAFSQNFYSDNMYRYSNADAHKHERHGRPTFFRNTTFFHIYIIAAFLAVLITWFGVNYLLGGMHSYA